MKNLISASLLTFALATGCSKKSDCEAVYEHTLSLLPAEMQEQVKQQPKEKAIEKCEKGSPEARKCALDAKSMEDLMKCPR